jgi:hypothetical protein
MIQLISVMVVFAVFFAIVGFLRGWNRELFGTAGLVLGIFVLFQFDPFLRSSVYLLLTPSQTFFLQSGIFLVVVFFMYRMSEGDPRALGGQNLQTSLLGGLAGALNGYLIAGSLWYFMDINEYPWPQMIIAPTPGSPSEQAINAIPLVLVSGGTASTGDFLAFAVIGLLVLVLVVL